MKKTKRSYDWISQNYYLDYINFEAGSPEALEQFNKAMKEIIQSETLIQQYKRKGYSVIQEKQMERYYLYTRY